MERKATVVVAGTQTLQPAIERPRQLLLRAGLTVLAVAVVSKVMTIAADSFVAARFGLTVNADAYLLSVGLMGALLAAPAETLRLAIVPVSGQYLRQGNLRAAAGAIVMVLGATLMIGAAATVVLMLIIPHVAPVLAPGFSDEGLATLTRLVRVLAVGIVAGLVLALLLGVLHTQLRFGVPALAGIGVAAGVIGVGLLFSDALGVTALAIGYVGGTITVVLVFAWLSRGVFKEGVSLRDAQRDVGPFAKLALPTGLAIAIVSIGAIVERAVASATGVGNVAALGFAIKLITQASLLSQSIWTPLTPLLTATGASLSGEGDSRLVPFSLRLVVLVLLLATALLIALRKPLVGVVFEHGAFTASDTGTTATLLALHSGSLIGEGLFMVAVVALLTFGDSLTRLVATGIFIALKVALIATLAPIVGVAGIALAASVSSLIAGVFAVRILVGRFAPAEMKPLMTLTGKAVAAGLVAFAVAALSSEAVHVSGGSESIAVRVTQLICGGTSGSIAFVGTLLLLNVEEARVALVRVWQRMRALDR